jgi:hypothetical protein
MASASNQSPRTTPHELAASHEDIELFRRLLRVARFVQAHDTGELSAFGSSNPSAPNNEVGNQGSSPPQYPSDIAAGRGFVGHDLIGNAYSGIGNTTRIGDGYNNVNELYDNEDDEGAGIAEQESINPTAISSQSSTLVTNAPQISQSKELNNQTHNTKETPRNQRHQQQPQQQQQRAHAAVEKRYRSVINSKIQQLSALISASNSFSLIDSNALPEDQRTGMEPKVPSKSIILDRAIQHINHLVSTYEQYETESNELRAKLQLWLDETSSKKAS